MRAFCLIILFTLTLWLPKITSAQEEDAVIYQSKKYIDLNIRSEERYHKRVEKQQQKALKKLSKKEKKYARNLKKKDPSSYEKYKQLPMPYDSIAKVSKGNISSFPRKLLSRSTGSIDSIKSVKKFLEDKAHVTGDGKDNTALQDDYSNRIASLGAQNNKQEHIKGLIERRTQGLQNINSATNGKIKGYKSFSKSSFYGKEKLRAFKDMKDEPSKAEERALEFLQGQEGFGEALQGDNAFSMAGMGSADLEKAGITTKRLMNQQLQQKFGKSMPSITDKLGEQVKDFKDKTRNVKSVTKSIRQVREHSNDVKHAQRPSINKPLFKVNPMKGMPLVKRVETQFTWQIHRASLDGKPAVIQSAAMAGFKHTPNLVYGVGVANSLGLGQSWDQVHFTFEGIGIRLYSTWQWQYGIGTYVGYERMYKQSVFDNPRDIKPEPTVNARNNNIYEESFLIGLTKSYGINDKWKGSIQILYDAWWRERGLKTPILVRFATLKK